MAGHGSDPAEDRANHPNRQVGRDSWVTATKVGPDTADRLGVEPNWWNRPRGRAPGAHMHGVVSSGGPGTGLSIRQRVRGVLGMGY